MSQFVGMVVEDVEALSRQMNQSAEEIRQLVNTLGSKIQSTQWTGPDREQFLGNWQGQYVGQLNTVAMALDDAARAAQQNATQQTQASA
ncbi:MAG: hypothetical protein HKP61_10825 [Dactylosporangium sp.]|nr:hypothetical protein [Dactylosporangium sp.]NNJ61422.1 hypothetical protein [Dactylosporangium sp.]